VGKGVFGGTWSLAPGKIIKMGGKTQIGVSSTGRGEPFKRGVKCKKYVLRIQRNREKGTVCEEGKTSAGWDANIYNGDEF